MDNIAMAGVDLTDALKNIRTPKLYREGIVLIGGFGFLLLFWTFFLRHTNLDSIFPTIGRFETDFIVLVMSYLTGHVILFCTSITSIVDDYFNREIVVGKKKTLWENIKSFFAYKSIINDQEVIDRLERKNPASLVYRNLGENQLSLERYDDSRQSLILADFFLFYSFILIFWVDIAWLKWLFVISALFFFWKQYAINKARFNIWLDIQILMHRDAKPKS
jgi:hypothetical protein